MRHFAWLAVLALAAGCRAGSYSLDKYYPPDEDDYYTEWDGSMMVDPALYENVKTGELGTDKTRGVAKSIDWREAGPLEGQTYMSGGISISSVQRGDADDFYSVRLLLRNKNVGGARIEYKIAFYNSLGERMLGMEDFVGDKEVWRSTVVDGLSHSSVTNSCRTKGAVTFRLFVRAAGSTGNGDPDAAAGRDLLDEERRRRLLGE